MIQLLKEEFLITGYGMKYDLSYYVLTSRCNNASFLQLHKLITFLLTTVSGEVSVVGDI